MRGAARRSRASKVRWSGTAPSRTSDAPGTWSVSAAVIVLLVAWSFGFSAAVPVRQAYLNGLIPSRQRATVLSFDSLLGSAGGVVLQPGLGRLADVSGYPPTFLVSAAFQACALPLLALARRERAATDVVVHAPDPTTVTRPAGPDAT